MVKGKLREKVPELVKALEGKMSQHHVQKLSLSLNHYLTINESIAEVEALICQKCAPFKSVIDLLLTVPGVNLTAAQAILTEIGADMRPIRLYPFDKGRGYKIYLIIVILFLSHDTMLSKAQKSSKYLFISSAYKFK